MENNLKAALEYLNADYLINSSIIKPIRTGTAEILIARRDCVLIKDKTTGVPMLQTNNMELAEKILETMPKPPVIVVHSDELCRLTEKILGFDVKVPCFQGVYRGKPFKDCGTGGLNIRLLGENDVGAACRLYHFTPESALEHIKKGLVYGGVSGGEIVAVIGMHLQGSMGILSVDEKFRRRGYAEILEKFLINKVLEKGLVPYCQIVEGNEASLSLQRKLGLELSENMLYWMRKE